VLKMGAVCDFKTWTWDLGMLGRPYDSPLPDIPVIFSVFILSRRLAAS
jgi:hypothetical protein